MRTSSWHIGCNSAIFLCFFFTILDGSSKRIFYTQKYLQQRVFTEKLFSQDKCFYCFFGQYCDALVKQSIETAIKICEKQEIPIEERRVQRKKKMPGEHAEDVGLSAVEEIKRYMLEAMDRFRVKQKSGLLKFGC